MCAAPKKNQFWKLRSSHGRDKIFQSPEILKAACFEYFETVTNNALKEQKVLYNGRKVTVDKMRPFTLKGLYVFLEINRQTWENYKKEANFLAIMEAVEDIIYTQKFEGAAAGFFKENLIARELGLSDKTGIKFEDLTDEQLDQLLKKAVSDE